jgi:hypothetical protein
MSAGVCKYLAARFVDSILQQKYFLWQWKLAAKPLQAKKCSRTMMQNVL